ncbi:hypothetical protein D3C73_703160 [compost metagenome]
MLCGRPYFSKIKPGGASTTSYSPGSLLSFPQATDTPSVSLCACSVLGIDPGIPSITVCKITEFIACGIGALFSLKARCPFSTVTLSLFPSVSQCTPRKPIPSSADPPRGMSTPLSPSRKRAIPGAYRATCASVGLDTDKRSPP